MLIPRQHDTSELMPEAKHFIKIDQVPSGDMSTLSARGAVNRAQKKNLETHSAVCIP